MRRSCLFFAIFLLGSLVSAQSVDYSALFWGRKMMKSPNFMPSYYVRNIYTKKIFGLTKYDRVKEYVTDNWDISPVEKSGSVDEIIYANSDSLANATRRLIKFMNDGYKGLDRINDNGSSWAEFVSDGLLMCTVPSERKILIVDVSFCIWRSNLDHVVPILKDNKNVTLIYAPECGGEVFYRRFK